MAEMEVSVADLHHGLDKCLQSVVRHRKERAVLGWKAWILEDPLARPERWLRPDLVPPSPFLQCDPRETVGGSGVVADPALIDAKFREAWMPYFSRSVKGSADLDDFSVEVGGGWLPVLDVFHLPPLTDKPEVSHLTPACRPDHVALLTGSHRVCCLIWRY